MFMLHKVVLSVLVLLGCMSKMLAAPVKLTEVVVSDAAEDGKAVDEVREKEYLNFIKKTYLGSSKVSSLVLGKCFYFTAIFCKDFEFWYGHQ